MAIAGRVAIVPKGNWSDIIQYEKLDLVYHLGSSYLAKQRSIGIDPTNEDFWMLIVTGTSDEQINILADQLEALDLEVDGVKTEVSEVKEDIANQVLVFNDVSVTVDSWTEDTTYEDYPYKADVACDGVTAEHKPDVTFDVAEAISGVYAPVAVTGSGVVSIYASEIPESAIVIPTIACVKAVGA